MSGEVVFESDVRHYKQPPGLFTSRFKGRARHAQLVETRDGAWKHNMNPDGQRTYRQVSMAKSVLAVVMGAAAVTTPATLVGLGILYTIANYTQAGMRADAEANGKVPRQRHILKNFAKSFFIPK
jgi:hypothetical protein